MTIVCLGWGSLIWDPRALPISSEWRTDGPSLPVEFARQSNDGRITLVLTQDATPIQVRWAKLDVSSVEDAKDRLAKREGVPDKFAHRSIGFWSPDAASDHRDTDLIGKWADGYGHRGVVWTALKPKFGSEYIAPTAGQVIEYLEGLTGDQKRRAKEYIRRTPIQIATAYRREIERALGWTPLIDE